MTDHLSLSGLCVRAGGRAVVDGMALRVQAGQVVGLVGASGSGKSLTARSLLGLVDLDPGVVAGDLQFVLGQRTFSPYARLSLGPKAVDADFQGVRGTIVGYLAQNARASLDPLRDVRWQVEQCARLSSERVDAAHWLRIAGFEEPNSVLAAFPHELSGGMAQRVAIAMALARGSRFLVADEPTTGLDPTVQAGLLARLRGLADAGLGLLLITHDLRALVDLADETVLIDQGRPVETLSAAALSASASTTETGQALFAATRRIAAGRLR